MAAEEIFKTERLILRRTRLDDADFILKLVNTPKWLTFIGNREVYNIDDAKRYIRDRVFMLYEKYGYGNFSVIRKYDNTIIGNCGLYHREGIDGVDIGFAFLPEYEGMGYAFESAYKVKELAKIRYNIKTLYAITIKENIGSQKLLCKLGLTYQKIINLPDADNGQELLLYKIDL